MGSTTPRTARERRTRTHSRLGMLALAVAASTLLSGCFLRSLVAFVDDNGDTSLSGNLGVSRCDSVPGTNSSFGCIYTITDGGGGLIGITSTLELIAELGVVGAIIDPLILQVPADATSVVATYNNAGSPQPLVITEATAFPVTPTTTVQAETGTKFLIFELPDAVVAALPPGTTDFDFSLDFNVGDPAALVVKPMLTASVDQAGVRYYLPLFPCVTDFAQVPEVQIAFASFFQDLRPQALAIAASGQQLACDQVTYDLTLAGAPTTTTAPATTSSTTTSTVAVTDPVATTVAPAGPPTTLTTVLPETGADTSTQIWIAIALLVGGVAVLLATRRRPSSRTF